MADSNEILRTEPSPRWVRVFLNGEAIANSRHTQLVWQGSYPTSYWFPREDVQFALLTPTAQANGRLRWNVRVGDRIAAGAAWQPIDLPEEHAVLSDHIAFEWASMDEWREEEETIIGHPRDPYTRIDCVQSSRHVVIEIDGQVVADSKRPMIVFETGMRNRYTCHTSTCKATRSSRASAPRSVRTRARPRTGRSRSQANSTTMSPGAIPTRCPSPSAYAATCASTTSMWT